MPLQPLSDSLGSWSSKREFSRRLAAATVVNAANDVANGRYRAVSFRSGTLTLEVTSGTARYLVQPELPALIAAVNAALGRPAVTTVKFRLAEAES